MSTTQYQTGDFADLGEVWLRYQTAVIRQKVLQFGGQHYPVDVGALLNQLARATRQVLAHQAPRQCQARPTDSLRRATIEAIELCARLDQRAAIRGRQPALAG